MMRRPVTLAAGVAAMAGALVGGLQHGTPSGHAGASVTPIAEIAHRVEAIRGLRFRSLPKVRRVTRKQLQQEADRALASLTPRERAADAASHDLAKLLGFEDPRATPEQANDTSDI